MDTHEYMDIAKRDEIRENAARLSRKFLRYNPKDIECVTFKNKSITTEYDLDWIVNNQDYPTLLNNFIYLFKFTDSQMRCTLVNYACSRGVIEDLFITKGKTMYKYGHSFKVINSLSDMQLMGYYDILAKENIWIEGVLKWFYEEYLHNEFMIEGFELRIAVKYKNGVMRKALK